VSVSRKSAREALLLSARELFWANGHSKVTVEEICEHAGISKMSFYRSFKNKSELLRILLVQFTDEGLAKAEEIMDQDGPIGKKLHDMLLYKSERAKGISPVLITDIYTKEPELVQELVAHSQTVREQFKQALMKAKADGEIRADLNIDFIIYMLNNFNDRMMSEDLLAQFDSMEDATHQITEFFFYGMLGKDPYE
jgi:AcrR family transcriptional regulator